MKYLLATLILVNGLYAVWNGLLERTASGKNLSVQSSPAGEMTSTVERDTRVAPAVRSHTIAHCQQLGPFNGLKVVERTQNQLLARGVETLLREDSLWQDSAYLVYLPNPRPGALDELRASNIDSAVIPRGALRGKISVGVFQRKEFALSQQHKVANLGYQTSLKTLRQERKVYHLLVQNAIQDLPEGLTVKNCTEIAPEQQFL